MVDMDPKVTVWTSHVPQIIAPSNSAGGGVFFFFLLCVRLTSNIM